MKDQKIKSLANCTDEEGLVQFNKARKIINEWCTATDIANIKKRLPVLEIIPQGTDKEQARLIKEKNDKAMQEQGMKNLNAILDAALETNRDLTLKVIRVCCFRDPDDSSLKFTELLAVVNDMISNKEILDFFIYTTNLGKSLGLTL